MRGKHLLCLSNQNRKALINALDRVFEIDLIKFIFTDQGVVIRFLQSYTASLGLTYFSRVIVLPVEMVLSTNESFETLLGVK